GATLTLAPPVFAEANTDAAKTNARPLIWQPCFTDENPRLSCAKFQVPFDYQARKGSLAAGKTIDLALIKLSAADTSQKPLGSLFLNPGGPGGSGFDWVRTDGQRLFSQNLLNRYDLIGFDPRGIHYSTAITCQVQADNTAPFYPSVDFPTNPAQIKERISVNKNLSALCAQNGGDILQHMSTADVARDLDLMRQAVGDPLLNFVGYSYGSYLGVTYANLFPERVGRVIVNGVLDPVQWSTGRGFSGWLVPMTQRIGSDKGSMATLNEFFRLCDLAGPDNCHFAPNSAQRFNALANTIKKQPIQLATPDGFQFEVDTGLFINTVKTSLYSTWNWQNLADLMAFTEAGAPPAVLSAQYTQLFNEIPANNIDQVPFDNNPLGFFSVLCSDSNNPRDAWLWPLAAAVADSENGYFGSSWSWNSSICATWPANQLNRYAGPFNLRTRNTVLIANTLFDPATPYSGAQAVRRLLPNSRLVTVAGWGHTTTGLSSCADNIIETYLLSGAVPQEDTTCSQEALPFNLTMDTDVFTGMPKITDAPAPIIRFPLLKTQLSEQEKTKRAALARAILREVLPHTRRNTKGY
ncbi:MAG TPA: alpha/beta hydrolase, partial [Cellvibrionaceae bacterium]|nr:alpha/beta hydrolase [Cellvibrionaceae bacterium]